MDANVNAAEVGVSKIRKHKEKVIDNDKEKDFVHYEDELRSLCSSDSDLDLSKPSNVFHEKDLEKERFQFVVGMIFNSNDEFKWAVKCNQALRKREIKFTKIEPVRITVVCKDVNCKWKMYASKSNSNSLLSIKSYNPDHTCAVQNDIKNVNAGFLAKYYQDEFKSVDDSWNRIQFQQQVKKKFNCVISKHQSWREKRLAHKENNGDDHKQFELLWDYCEELRKSNPGTTAKMKVDEDFTISGTSSFMTLYICYAACREGFLAGCRPFIGLDGCHLKGCQKGGQLLTTVGVDANNAMFPIAFAIVEGELKETWAWFLELLDQDLNISENLNAWTIISDKQKGLLPAVEEQLSGVEHRFWVRHMHANFVKDGFSGQLLKHKLWAICRATTVPEYLTKMEELRKLNPKAADWVSAREPHHYCRAFFSSFPNCDILLNNLCESWNSSILQFRENGIMTMCENIRLYLMVRMQQNRDNMKKYHLKICPKIMKLVEEAKDKSNDCTAYRSKDDVYEVEDRYGRKYKVDLSQYHYSCRRWDLTGIPCSHNIAAIRRKGCIPKEYVNNCYTVESYLRSYEPAILPVTSSEL
nr:uncharacterized protein LOC109174707 [Ipomoea batatas]